ncbi:MAG: hypothetical protein ACRCSV_01810 [Chlamydiales bacterium]
METLSNQDKVQKICDTIRRDTLLPAELQAEEILKNAERRAAMTLEKARQEAKQLQEQARIEILKDKQACISSLQIACKQTLDLFKQKIEKKVFHDGLSEIIEETTKKPEIITRCIESVLDALAKEGIEQDLQLIISKSVSPRDVIAMLVQKAVTTLESSPIQLDSFAGGAKIRIKGQHLTIDVSDIALKELIAGFLREDFRTLVFSS